MGSSGHCSFLRGSKSGLFAHTQPLMNRILVEKSDTVLVTYFALPEQMYGDRSNKGLGLI